MTVISKRALSDALEKWAEQNLTIKSGNIIDLTPPGSIDAIKDLMRENLKNWFSNRGIHEVGASFALTDDKDVEGVPTDFIRVTIIVGNITASTIVGGWLNNTGFDIDGDGR